MKWELIPSHSFDKWLWILHLIWKLVIVFVFLPYLPNCHSRRLHRADAFHFSIIFFQREWQFAPWCAFTMFWLLLTAVVAQLAGMLLSRRNSVESTVNEQEASPSWGSTLRRPWWRWCQNTFQETFLKDKNHERLTLHWQHHQWVSQWSQQGDNFEWWQQLFSGAGGGSGGLNHTKSQLPINCEDRLTKVNLSYIIPKCET